MRYGEHVLSGTIKTAGIDGMVAHIHVGAPGQSGPPIITLNKGADGVWSVPAGSKLTTSTRVLRAAICMPLVIQEHRHERCTGEANAVTCRPTKRATKA